MRVLLLSEDEDTLNAPVHRVLVERGVVFRRIVLAKLRPTRGPYVKRKLQRYFPPEQVTAPIARAVAEFKPHLVHAAPGRGVGLAMIKAVRLAPDLPLLFDHGVIGALNLASPLDWMLYFNRRITKLVVPTRAVVNHWMGNFLLRRCITPGRCAVLHHAIVHFERADAEDRKAIRARMGFADNEFVIGTVCSNRPIKNLDFVADVVRQLGGKTLFAVVGGARQPEYHDRLVRAGGGQLRLLGPIPNARSVMAAFDLYVTPTRLPGESFGLAPAEAMSQGVPVLTMNFGGTAEIVEHGVSGLTLPHDSGQWKEAIIQMTADPVRLAQMGAAARARISSRFSPEAIADDCLDLYRRTIAYYSKAKS